MSKRIYTSVAIVITLALLFVLKVYVSDLFFDTFFALVACFAAFEMSRLFTKIGRYHFHWLVTLFPALMFAGNLIGIHFCSTSGDLFWVLYTILIDLAIMLVVSGLAFLFSVVLRKKTLNEIAVRELKNTNLCKFSFKKALNTLACFVYPSFLFLLFMLVNHIGELPLAKLKGMGVYPSVLLLLTAILIPMITDTFAMLIGQLFGGKKLCPKISPDKHISGAIGGVLWSVVVCACIYLVFGCIEVFQGFLGVFPIWAYLIVVAIGSCVSQASDIFESVIKRRAGVKDSGKILPGHGGMLDRIDSYIFIAPYVLLAFWICLL